MLLLGDTRIVGLTQPIVPNRAGGGTVSACLRFFFEDWFTRTGGGDA